MGKLQDVTRFLLAAGASPSKDGKVTHFFYEAKNALSMETWTGTEISDKAWVATGVRSGTSAAVVDMDYKRVFVVDQNHLIKSFAEPDGERDDDAEDEDDDDEDALWEEEDLDDVNVRVHPQSQLDLSCGSKALFVFYQNPDGSLGAIEEGSEGWKAVNLPASIALGGTPLASFNTKEALYLFYLGVDGTVRYMEHSGSEWKDSSFSNAKIDGAAAASKLSIAEDEQASGGPKLLAFCLANNKLSTIKWGGDSVETLGTVRDGVYQPTSDQECVKYYRWSPYPSYYVNGYGQPYQTNYGYPYDNTSAPSYYVYPVYYASRCKWCRRREKKHSKKCRC
ncbi:hypothetical protein V8C37DRAFT_374450 [Trichoderma ceciliae]